MATLEGFRVRNFVSPVGTEDIQENEYPKIDTYLLQHTQSNRMSIIDEGIVGYVMFVEYVRRRIR